jgi:hypothetical protein
LAEHIDHGKELLFRRTGTGNPPAFNVKVVAIPRNRHAQRPGFQAVANGLLHRGQLCWRGGALIFLAGLPHGVIPHRGMRDQHAGIDPQALLHDVHIVGERGPVPRHPSVEHVHRDGFDIG